MIRLRTVEEWNVAVFSKAEYDAIIASVGYEARSRYVAQTYAPKSPRKYACAFAQRQQASFAENAKWYAASKYEYIVLDDSKFGAWANETLKSLSTSTEQTCRLAIDISSISRVRLAILISTVMRLQRKSPIVIDFIYALASFVPPREESELISQAGPVLPTFAGWSSQPDLPTVAIVGLGYEPDKAVGAYEYLEASRVLVFIPKGGDLGFEREVRRANASLLEKVPKMQQITYAVEHPLRCFTTLESATFGALQNGRPVLLPFGPKIFAACALLVGCIHRQVAVWRVSPGQNASVMDQTASGRIVGIRAVFEPSKVPARNV